MEDINKRYLKLKRVIDILFSLLGVILLSPFLIIIALLIKATSNGPIIFKQDRIGLNGRSFKILKFRTMVLDAEQRGKQITVHGDSRITKIGLVLRKLKLDELPQLFNVFIGDMSLVGPRPEVKKYVDIYTQEQLQVLSVRPGITDFASLEFSNENEILAISKNPEETYIKEIMPKKLNLNLRYIREISLLTDIKLILMTILKVFINRNLVVNENEGFEINNKKSTGIGL